MINPSGSIMRFPPDFLEQIPFTDYFLPGLILFSCLGLVPTFSLYGLVKKANWKWPERINIFPRRHWAWTGSVYTGIMLLVWITVQLMLLGYRHIIQVVYGLTGVMILVFSLLPPVMKHCARQKSSPSG